MTIFWHCPSIRFYLCVAIYVCAQSNQSASKDCIFLGFCILLYPRNSSSGAAVSPFFLLYFFRIQLGQPSTVKVASNLIRLLSYENKVRAVSSNYL